MRDTTEFREIAVFGARGHSLMILRGLEEGWQGRVRVRALIDDIEHGFIHPAFDVPVISSEQRLCDYADLPVLLTVSAPALRRRIAGRLDEEGATLATACFPEKPHVDPDVQFGAGTICMPWTRFGPNVRLGTGVMVLASSVAHDVGIGAFSTLAGDTLVAGHVQIGEGVNIAPRAVISNGTRQRRLRIGDNAVIGTGAVVVGAVPDGSSMIGNPAMPLRSWVRLRRLARAGQAVSPD